METLNKQIAELKEKYGNETMIWFELNGFIEVIGEDAVKTANILGTILTKRNELSLTGFTAERLEMNLQKAVRGGNKVALVTNL